MSKSCDLIFGPSSDGGCLGLSGPRAAAVGKRQQCCGAIWAEADKRQYASTPLCSIQCGQAGNRPLRLCSLYCRQAGNRPTPLEVPCVRKAFSVSVCLSVWLTPQKVQLHLNVDVKVPPSYDPLWPKFLFNTNAHAAWQAPGQGLAVP